MTSTEPRIGLVLSGGGIRAMAYHAGVLRHMAERRQFENVTHISTVSGGSLVVGLIIQLAGGRWPSSQEYVDKVAPQLAALLTCQTRSLRKIVWKLLRLDFAGAFKAFQEVVLVRDVLWAAVLEILKRPWLLLSRPHALARAYQRCWGITSSVGQIPESPEWSINGTSAEYGVRFRFKRKLMGDYEVGYARCDHLPLALAMAVSSAVPGVIGALRIWLRKGKWFEWKADLADAIDKQQAVTKKLQFRWLALYDGGVYDNLGLEPFFDCGCQHIKKDIDINCIVVSDAGKPLGIRHLGFIHTAAMRVFDIASNQSRALRVRAFSNYLINGNGHGALYTIGTLPQKFLKKYQPGASPACFELNADQVAFASSYKTTLFLLPASAFKLIECHGYECALAYEMAFGPLAMLRRVEN